jgi:hypothetical protein
MASSDASDIGTPDAAKAVIVERLGSAARRREVVVGGRRYEVFEASADLAELDGVIADVPRFRDRDVRLFLTVGGTVLCAVWGLAPADIVKMIRVGTHNGHPEDWRTVYNLVAPLLAAHPGDVVFADEAGLDIRFPAPIAPDEARRLDTTLLDAFAVGDNRLLDSYLFMCDEAGRLGLVPDPLADPRGGGLVAALVASGRLRLWWD